MAGEAVPGRGGPIRVCLDARLRDGEAGGVQQTLIGLAEGLSRLRDGDEEYHFLARRDDAGWLLPHLRGRCRLLEPPLHRPARWKRLIRPLVPERVLELAYPSIAYHTQRAIPPSDGTVERAGIHVMHFTLQRGFKTTLPSIYVPHDLQHRHMPELFRAFEIRWREAFYPALCAQAARVVALSEWGRRDLMSQYAVPDEKIRVIGWAPVLDAYAVPTEAEIDAIARRLDLPRAFALYPAQTFRHKNHLRLLQAVDMLRERVPGGIPLVCCGRTDAHHRSTLAPAIRRLGLEGQVRFLGHVDTAVVQALYRRARMLVFPSLFEGFGMPVLEAFRAGLPVACSRVTALPEVAGDAALLFDPTAVDEIASAMLRLWTDGPLRNRLILEGRARASRSTWEEVGRTYRALYREVARGCVGPDDAALLRAARPGSRRAE